MDKLRWRKTTMTNEEASDILERGFHFSSTHGINRAVSALNKAKSALQENTKLKAEIEQLKERLEIKDNNFELYSDALDEIERLKSELERSVKLPCKVGDTIYKIPSNVSCRLNILNKHPENNKVYCQVVSSIGIYPSGYILNTCDELDCVIEQFFNETWFLKQEAAEQALKRQVEE